MWGTRPEKNTLVKSLMQDGQQDVMMGLNHSSGGWHGEEETEFKWAGHGDGGGGGQSGMIPGLEACLVD